MVMEESPVLARRSIGKTQAQSDVVMPQAPRLKQLFTAVKEHCELAIPPHKIDFLYPASLAEYKQVLSAWRQNSANNDHVFIRHPQKGWQSFVLTVNGLHADVAAISEIAEQLPRAQMSAFREYYEAKAREDYQAHYQREVQEKLKQSLRTVSRLLEEDAKQYAATGVTVVNDSMYAGETLFHIVSRYGNRPLADELLKHPALRLNVENVSGTQVLQHLIMHRRHVMLDHANAHAELSNISGPVIYGGSDTLKSYLQLAVETGDPRIVRIVLEMYREHFSLRDEELCKQCLRVSKEVAEEKHGPMTFERFYAILGQLNAAFATRNLSSDNRARQVRDVLAHLHVRDLYFLNELLSLRLFRRGMIMSVFPYLALGDRQQNKAILSRVVQLLLAEKQAVESQVEQVFYPEMVVYLLVRSVAHLDDEESFEEGGQAEHAIEMRYEAEEEGDEGLFAPFAEEEHAHHKHHHVVTASGVAANPAAHDHDHHDGHAHHAHDHGDHAHAHEGGHGDHHEAHGSHAHHGEHGHHAHAQHGHHPHGAHIHLHKHLHLHPHPHPDHDHEEEEEEHEHRHDNHDPHAHPHPPHHLLHGHHHAHDDHEHEDHGHRSHHEHEHEHEHHEGDKAHQGKKHVFFAKHKGHKRPRASEDKENVRPAKAHKNAKNNFFEANEQKAKQESSVSVVDQADTGNYATP